MYDVLVLQKTHMEVFPCHFIVNSANTEVSLAVHRVGQTLLLDCLDVPALISYASQVGVSPGPSYKSSSYRSIYLNQ